MLDKEQSKIKEFIRNKKLSHLSFLDDVWSTSDNKDYIGFYYFILHLKDENNKHVFDEIINREGSLSKAYLYLGNIARDIFTDIELKYISLEFFSKAVKEDDQNSEAYFQLYYYTRSLKYLVELLKVEFKKNNINEHIMQVSQTFSAIGMDKLSKEDLLFLKEIYTLPDLPEDTKKQNILASLYFYLDESDLGREIIVSSDELDFEIIKKYLDGGLIDLDLALSKVSFYNRERLLSGDHKRIYEIYKEEAKKSKTNPIKDVLIHKAFLADEFMDVITYYQEATDIFNKLKPSLHYLLSQIALKQEIDKNIYEYIKEDLYLSVFNHSDKEIDALNLILIFKLHCINIEKNYSDNKVGFSLKISRPYKKALEILDKPEIVGHNLYDDLKQQLLSLREKNTLNRGSLALDQFKNFQPEFITNYSDLNEYCNTYIKVEKYDDVIATILHFHKKNPPSMNTMNCLGVCYEHKKDYENAVIHYKNSLDIMHSSKEINFQIIQNYLYCYRTLPFEKLPIEKLLIEEFEKLKHEYNLCLVSDFKWDYSWSGGSKTLFKYSPFNINIIDSLSNQYFYLPSKKQLNDPIELPDLTKIRANTFIYQNYYICSFSKNENSMLMWSHYAEQHKGIMVEYWFAGEMPNSVGIGPVNYSTDQKRLKEKDNYVFNQFLLTKNKDWDYENEVRIFSFLENKVGFTRSNYLNLDRSKINARVKSITLGLQFPEDKKKLIGNIVQSLNSKLSPDDPEILVRQAFICENNNFALIYKDITLS
ncbi:MAG: DUF2971 domain-containing protein [Candidatus Acinetobacter avistercoris]|uniref:DUF2971 domain-containing protein n=1 Tax=Acinetobacter sp. KS-LM10 TaxID=3120518 RepID=UPI001F9BDA49|nr:DUF2971 domain-containing protein [Candidatus Acinetobacter avistercoris]